MGSEPTRNAAVELIVVVVGTMADTFTGTREAELNGVLDASKSRCPIPVTIRTPRTKIPRHPV
jgi:hypothetical protein